MKVDIAAAAAAVKSIFAVSRKILDMPLHQFVETFQFSQDFLESFFGIVRAHLVGKNNPTVLQLMYALRRMIFNNVLQGSPKSNVVPVSVPIGAIFNAIPIKKIAIEPFEDPEQYCVKVHQSVVAAL